MKYVYLAAVASAAIVAGPAFAQDISYANNINTSVVTDVTYTKDVALYGDVALDGRIRVDSSAVAVNDVKQLQNDTTVRYREENEINGENGYVDPIFGPGWSEAGNDPNDQQANGTLEGQIRAGYFAPIINRVNGYDVAGSGNVGVNMAAGYFNDQLNSAAIASATNEGMDDNAGGWAEASTTSLQWQANVAQFGASSDVLPQDDLDLDGGGNNFRDRNLIAGGTVAGSGNVGVNAAAGSFNQQANLMTIAVADNSVLAEANAALIQTGMDNRIEQQDSINSVDGPTVRGSGNVGVNLASGVGNQQLNSLTIAASRGAGGVDAGNGNGMGNGDGS